jgi:hypothetical protein
MNNNYGSVFSKPSSHSNSPSIENRIANRFSGDIALLTNDANRFSGDAKVNRFSGEVNFNRFSGDFNIGGGLKW